MHKIVDFLLSCCTIFKANRDLSSEKDNENHEPSLFVTGEAKEMSYSQFYALITSLSVLRGNIV